MSGTPPKGDTLTYFQPSQITPREIAPGIRTRPVWGERIMVSIIDVDPGSEVPPHVHPHEQMGLILEGGVTMMIGGDLRVLNPGDVYLVPPDVEHGAFAGSERARIADIFSPPREDYM
jgi:quercetin dioxygenase-like cupin family protein